MSIQDIHHKMLQKDCRLALQVDVTATPRHDSGAIFVQTVSDYRFKATGHGFRATASTILNEHGFTPDVIERQLAHTERNKVRAAYNHAEHLPERRKMMQWWADYLEGIAKPANPTSV